MKLKKAEISIIIITIIFISFTIGFFIGRSTGEKNISISVAEESTAEPASISPEADGEKETAPAERQENPEQNGKLVNINTASAEELETLSGIGQVLAARIIEYREQNGGFENIYEITRVRGIGEKIYDRIKDNISV